MASDKSFWQWIEQRQEAKARLMANRRTLLKGAGAGAIAAAGARIGLAPPASAQSALPYEGVTLRVLTQTGPFIAGPVKFHAPEFQEQYGGVVEVIEAPPADLFARAQQVAQTGSGDFDILLLANTWMPDFVNLGYAISLQELVDRDIDDELLAWDDIPDGIKRKNSWGGQTYTYIVDNDNQTMFYRKDILEDPKWQEAY
jgi:multiple sugar transport system substrate-binding protein